VNDLCEIDFTSSNPTFVETFAKLLGLFLSLRAPNVEYEHRLSRCAAVGTETHSKERFAHEVASQA
jgi:hypothetical protein